MQDLVFGDDPAECLAVIVDLVHASWNPWQRTMIGADPLESLVSSHLEHVLDAVDQAIGTDTSFVPVLEAVWPGTKTATEHVDAILARLREARRYEPTPHTRKRGPGRHRDTP